MRWWKHDWRLKLVAFGIALVVWFFVNRITNDRRVVQAVPLEVRTRAGVMVLQQSTTMVDVEIRGTRNDVRQVSREDLVVRLDLSRETSTGEQSYRLGPAAVLGPRWVQPVAVQPARVTLVVDEVVNRELKVVPQIVGELPPGFRIERVLLHPAEVTVRGPKSRLEKETTISTLPIDVGGRRTSFRERVELTTDPLADLPVERRRVEVDVRIWEPGQAETGRPKEPEDQTRTK